MLTPRHALLLGLFVSCGEDAQPGDPCVDGGACEDDQACVIEASGSDGECATLPDSCEDFPSCEDACFATFPEVCAGEFSCTSMSGRVTVTCL